MAQLIFGGESEDYLGRYFMRRLGSAIEAIVSEETHVCGFCSNFVPYEDRDDYGECEFVDSALGFDCAIGKECKYFNRSKSIELDLKVVG